MRVKELLEVLKALEDTDMEVCFLDHTHGICDVVHVEIATLTDDSGIGIVLKDA